ncbi:tetratricopeptide repeat-containing sensor histidine kinase [Aureibaculum conchae]|uniref:tetratricopeptide repeat-containing sensor histidine kinase n=1 Tax=Aureibaculum sp. 2308TA14-22 TaxID=3108392 RepID=UPI003397961E
MRQLLFFILLVFYSTVNSQSIDELKLVIEQDTSAVNRINNTLKISAIFARSNLDSALFYADEAINIATDYDDKLLTKSLLHKGTFLTLKGDFKNGDSILNINFERPIDSTTLGLNYINLANSFQFQKRFDEAITNYLKASEIFEEQKNKIRLAQIYGNIGVLNAKNKNFDKAVNYLNKAIKNADQNEILKIQYQINLSSLYIDQNKYLEGLELAYLAEELAKKNNFNRGLASIYTNLCKIYSNSDSLKNTKKAIDYGLLALKIKKEVGNIPVYGETLNNIGQAYLKEGDYSKASIYLKEAIQNSTGDLKTAVLNNLKNIYAKLGNNQLALNYSDQLIQHKDSLTAAKQQEKVTEIIESYESEKKQRLIDVLNVENELQQAKLESQRNLFIGFGILGLLSILLAYLWFQNQKTKQSLQQEAMKHKLLQTQLNPHFLFHSLNSIQSFIHQNKKEESSSYLVSYSKLMRTILESSDQDFISVDEDIAAIEEYVKLQRLNLPDDVQIAVESDDLIGDCKIPPMFVQPYVENALIHGINSIEKGVVCILYKDLTTKVQVIISDNGKGLSTNKGNNELHRSMSTEIIQQRIQNLKQVYNYKINIFTKQSDKGTQIVIEFPKKLTK